MDLIGNTDSKRIAMLSVVWGVILILSLSHSTANGEFHILDMGENICHTIFSAIIILVLLTAVLHNRKVKFTGYLSAVLGIIMAVFGICLMTNIVDNYTGYFGWALTIAGIGCIYCAYLSRLNYEN